ncbi:hypothetical protein NDU88_002464 [Pleurodeles waltl]|uniref:Uncharacterized protein n=1 Tax=Pleurodeles waltl TaxID=8319 RepID=A0AAV7W2G7_PLEWA|nr:hypothetical protein NDU88_002464 [Pleurodeles waltl]
MAQDECGLWMLPGMADTLITSQLLLLGRGPRSAFPPRDLVRRRSASGGEPCHESWDEAEGSLHALPRCPPRRRRKSTWPGGTTGRLFPPPLELWGERRESGDEVGGTLEGGREAHRPCLGLDCVGP